ncbi:ACT domain-containing protein [uncultured Porticoccus sp.]|uniref:glycine cleavage system protein R n=1 Tax=uncultured Porticoccus sp. TaxID=1256050 RepID=UPI00261C52EC|nr:ACT domain-containing protein [uncultured Porticoccus sp.]
MKHYLALTVIADDRPGIVERIADVVTRAGGNWLESSMSRLAGKFAGILLVDIAEDRQTTLLTALEQLQHQGIRVTGEACSSLHSSLHPADGERVTLTVVGNDRAGIVGEISGILAKLQVNVEELCTHCEDAPMSSEILFRASATLQLPQDLDRGRLQQALESVSDDLMVELEQT